MYVHQRAVCPVGAINDIKGLFVVERLFDLRLGLLSVFRVHAVQKIAKSGRRVSLRVEPVYGIKPFGPGNPVLLYVPLPAPHPPHPLRLGKKGRLFFQVFLHGLPGGYVPGGAHNPCDCPVLILNGLVLELAEGARGLEAHLVYRAFSLKGTGVIVDRLFKVLLVEERGERPADKLRDPPAGKLLEGLVDKEYPAPGVVDIGKVADA